MWPLILKAFSGFRIRTNPPLFISVVVIAILYMCSKAVAESPFMEVVKTCAKSIAVPSYNVELDDSSCSCTHTCNYIHTHTCTHTTHSASSLCLLFLSHTSIYTDRFPESLYGYVCWEAIRVHDRFEQHVGSGVHHPGDTQAAGEVYKHKSAELLSRYTGVE